MIQIDLWHPNRRRWEVSLPAVLRVLGVIGFGLGLVFITVILGWGLAQQTISRERNCRDLVARAPTFADSAIVQTSSTCRRYLMDR